MTTISFLVILDIIGTIAFALAGYIISVKSEHDLLGISIITYVSAFGGGVIRDILLSKTPFIFVSSYPLVVASLVILFAWIFNYHNNEKLYKNKIFILADAIGLVMFAYTGAIAGIAAGFNIGGVLFLGFITAVGGGMIRDTIMNKDAYVLSGGFYGTIGLIVSLLVYIFSYLLILNPTTTVIIIVFGIILRILAVKYNWRLHKIKNT